MHQSLANICLAVTTLLLAPHAVAQTAPTDGWIECRRLNDPTEKSQAICSLTVRAESVPVGVQGECHTTATGSGNTTQIFAIVDPSLADDQILNPQKEDRADATMSFLIKKPGKYLITMNCRSTRSDAGWVKVKYRKGEDVI